MNRTARLVLKIVGASLAAAALVCLALGYWNELISGADRMKSCAGAWKSKICRKSNKAEYEHYADEELYE